MLKCYRVTYYPPEVARRMKTIDIKMLLPGAGTRFLRGWASGSSSDCSACLLDSCSKWTLTCVWSGSERWKQPAWDKSARCAGWHRLEPFGKREHPLTSTSLPFPWLMVDVGGSSSLWMAGGPCCYKKTSRASRRSKPWEQAREQATGASRQDLRGLGTGPT